jgi:hypothetical protein
MKLKDLKAEAKRCGIDCRDMPANALRVLVMMDAGFSTSGSPVADDCPRQQADDADGEEVPQVEIEAELLSPPALQKMSGWTKDIQKIPDIDIGKVKFYLMKSNSPEFSAKELRSYR